VVPSAIPRLATTSASMLRPWRLFLPGRAGASPFALDVGREGGAGRVMSRAEVRRADRTAHNIPISLDIPISLGARRSPFGGCGPRTRATNAWIGTAGCRLLDPHQGAASYPHLEASHVRCREAVRLGPRAALRAAERANHEITRRLVNFQKTLNLMCINHLGRLLNNDQCAKSIFHTPPYDAIYTLDSCAQLWHKVAHSVSVLQVAEMLDFYSVLGLSRHANQEEIKAAYWNLAKQSHPDVNAGDEQAEQRTKAINRAYETLGDPDARAAYDLELQLQRARAWRSFWTSAATGVATCVLTVGSFTAMVMWKQHAGIHPSPSSEVALATGSAKSEHVVTKPSTDRGASVPSNALALAGGRDPLSEDVVDTPSEPVDIARNEELLAKPPANERANVPPAALAAAEGSHATTEDVAGPPSEPVRRARHEDLVAKPPADERASVPAELADAEGSYAPSQSATTPPSGPSGEPPRSAHVKVVSAALRDARAVPPSAVLDGSSDDKLPNELWGTVQVPDGQRVVPAPGGETSRVAEHGNGIAPDVDAKLPTSAAAVDQKSSGTLALHDEPKTPPLPRAHERTKKYFYKNAIAKPTTPGKPQGPEQTSRLVAKSAMALRFPSADEPYINLGVRDR
jgi:hypothetical protein